MTDIVAAVQRVATSIRTRLLLAIVVVLALGLGATAVGTRQVLMARVDERVQDQLASEAGELRLFAEQGIDPRTGEGFGTDAERMLEVFLGREIPSDGEVMVTYVDGEPTHRTAQRVPFRVDTDPSLTARWGQVTETQSGVVETPAGPFEYLAVPVQTEAGPPAVFLAGMFRDIVAAEVDQTVRVTAWVALASLVAGLGVAVGLARRILTPLGRVSRTAEEITESDLSQRLDMSGHDEVARLAATFNSRRPNHGPHPDCRGRGPHRLLRREGAARRGLHHHRGGRRGRGPEDGEVGTVRPGAAGHRTAPPRRVRGPAWGA